MAQNDRRTSYMSTNKPRVASNRAGELDRTALPRNENSPLMAQARGGHSSSTKGLSREYSSSNEKRTEKTQTTTREKVQVRTRNSVKEPFTTATNRGDAEKVRIKQAAYNEAEAPVFRKKEKEPVERKSSPSKV